MFDRSTILRRAWGFYRASFNYPPTRALSHRARLARAMRNAWAEAKRKAAEAAKARQAVSRPPMSKAARELSIAILTLDAKERWTDHDRERMTDLRRQLRAA